ncbi:serine/threonine-protein phosphatase [Streptomyces sp. J2-1]|nr:serine/threonine-protein phosphatase [Streptomyces corallincola]
MTRWLHARRAPTSTGTGGPAAADPGPEGAPALSGDLLAGIGTTLDESATCAELTRAVVRLAGGAAAVVRRTGRTLSGYEAVTGDPALLPGAEWAAGLARDTATGPRRDSRAEYTGPGTSALGLPLASGDDQYGVLVWACGRPRTGRVEPGALALLAERAASHIRHARTFAEASRTVGDLQRALLAEPGRPHPNLDVAVRYHPAGGRTLVGGDWCETVRLHFGRTLLVVGDVMGHGLEAAVDMNAYRSSLRAIASSDLPPHRVLRQMDDIAAGEPDRRPATCLLARVDPGRGQVTVAGAGHLPPVLIGPDGTTSLLPVPVGPPLGTGLGGYESATHRLGPGDTLVAFTDGLVERRGEDIDRSLARLAALRFGAGDGIEVILDTVLAGLDAHRAEDDVAVLAARPHPRTDTGPPRGPTPGPSSGPSPGPDGTAGNASPHAADTLTERHRP